MQKHVCYRYINRMCFVKNCDHLCEEQSYFETVRFDGSRCFVTPLSARIGETNFALFHFSQLKVYFEKKPVYLATQMFRQFFASRYLSTVKLLLFLYIYIFIYKSFAVHMMPWYPLYFAMILGKRLPPSCWNFSTGSVTLHNALGDARGNGGH